MVNDTGGSFDCQELFDKLAIFQIRSDEGDGVLREGAVVGPVEDRVVVEAIEDLREIGGELDFPADCGEVFAWTWHFRLVKKGC